MYKSKYLPFFIESGTAHNTHSNESESDMDIAPVGQLRGQISSLGQLTNFAPVHMHHHRPQLPSQGHQSNARHVVVSHLADANIGQHLQPAGDEPFLENESGRTIDQGFRLPPREHRDNQQDFEDTVRTRQ